jgi:hypothetical protein
MTNQPSREKQDASDLEIRILACRENRYPVEITVEGQQVFSGSMDKDRLSKWRAAGSPTEAGRVLYDSLFASPGLNQSWGVVQGKIVRVRLRIDPAAAELHAVPWENLCEGDVWMAASAATPFSRYLPIALPWSGPVEERPIRILVVISHSQALQQRFNLDTIDITEERAALEEGLAPLGQAVEVDYLLENVTLKALEARLRQGKGFHILHFVGHGFYERSASQAFLMLPIDDGEGSARPAADADLVRMLAHLPVRPLLVFLAACQSATRSTTDADAFRGLGPRLVEIGVPAVIAMQETVTKTTARTLEKTFYENLAEYGQVDLAFNEARATLLTTGRRDAAVPVLFMRLKSGRLWSEESNAVGTILGEDQPRIFWEDLVDLLKENLVIPILGPRAHGQWLPTPWEIAGQWSARYEYPFSSQEDLARVAQFMQTSGQRDLRKRYARALRDGFLDRLPEGLRPDPPPETLSGLVQAVHWNDLLEGHPNEVHRVLAGLDRLDLYLTTNPDCLLVEALKAAGRSPQRELCRWKPELDREPSLLPENFYSSRGAPLVYHLFGIDEIPRSLVLTEDDYFDYLMEISAFKYRIPQILWGKISTRALMFVGYSLYDWEFRVLLHQLITRGDERGEFRHYAVQLEFSDAAGADQKAIKRFLENYLRDSRISVYWGSPAQFIAELRQVWEAAR